MEGLNAIKSKALHLNQVSRPLFTELSPDIWSILSKSSKMEYERLEREFIGYIGEFNLSYEQLVNSEEKITDL